MSRFDYRDPGQDPEYCDRLESTTRFCRNCGADLEIELPDRAQYCGHCEDERLRAALDAEMEKRWEERTGR